MTDLARLQDTLLGEIAAAKDEHAIEAIRVAALGKNGSISALLKSLGAIAPEQRREQGAIINGLKDRVTQAISARKKELRDAALDQSLAIEAVDVTLPVREPAAEAGRIHPVTQVTE